MTDVRKGQWPGTIPRESFAVRFRKPFRDPAFAAEDAAIERLECIAWDAYAEGRKALDEDTAVQEEVRNVGRALVRSVEALRRGDLQSQRPTLRKPRPKRASLLRGTFRARPGTTRRAAVVRPAGCPRSRKLHHPFSTPP